MASDNGTHLAIALKQLLGLPDSFTSLRLTWDSVLDSFPVVEIEMEVKPYVVQDDQLLREYGRFVCTPIEAQPENAPAPGEPMRYTDATMVAMMRERGLPGVALWMEDTLAQRNALRKENARLHRLVYLNAEGNR